MSSNLSCYKFHAVRQPGCSTPWLFELETSVDASLVVLLLGMTNLAMSVFIDDLVGLALYRN